MNDIFDIKFSFEQKMKEDVIQKFSNKQGGGFNVFAFHWQCFAWAATIGFIYNIKKPLSTPIADRPFSLRTMFGNGGEKVGEALLCMCISRAGSLDIMKEPENAIAMINEYANGGFYYIKDNVMNGTEFFNDFSKVKHEIFGRNLDDIVI